MALLGESFLCIADVYSSTPDDPYLADCCARASAPGAMPWSESVQTRVRPPAVLYTVSSTLRVAEGDDDGGPRIVRYNERALLRGGIFTIWRGTILNSRFAWTQLFLLVLVSLGAGVVTFQLLKGGAPGSETTANVSSRVVVSSSLKVLVIFVLSFFTEKVIGIWFTLRFVTIQKLWNAVDNMCLRAAVYFPNATAEDASARETVLRYGLLSMALLFQEAREEDVWDDGEHNSVFTTYRRLVADGLLTPDEERALVAAGPAAAKAQIPLVWLASLFTKWTMDGRLPFPLENQAAFMEHVASARNAVAEALATVTTQFPLSHKHLVVFTAKLMMLTEAIEVGVIGGSAAIDGQWEFVCARAVVLLVTPLIYQGLLEISERVANPFLTNRTDWSFKVFASRLEHECHAFFAAGQTPPYAAEDGGPAVLPPQLLEVQVSSAQLRA